MVEEQQRKNADPANRSFTVGQRWLLLVPLLSWAATLVLTWETWKTRERPLNLPWTQVPMPWEALPSLDWAWPMMITLIVPLVWPRPWSLFPFLLVGCGALLQDQVRLQPQFIGLTMMLAAVLVPAWRRCARWYLLSMWFWAGLHKLLSEDWRGPVTSSMLGGIEWLEPHFVGFAIAVAVGEMALAATAWRFPRLGILGCLVLHLGIVGWLIAIDWNQSVIPWNVSLAVVGSWLLWQESLSHRASAPEPPGHLGRSRPVNWEWAVLVVWLVLPAGFYMGWVRHSVAHALYSDNFPIAAVTSAGHVQPVEYMKTLGVPFPHTQSAFKIFLARSGAAGDKLHVLETRFEPHNQFFELDADGRVIPITRDAFFEEASDSARGVAIDDPRCMLRLAMVGVDLLKRDRDSMIYAVRFHPQLFDADRLEDLAGLLNLEQIQFADCPLSDGDLDRIPVLPVLTGIGLQGTDVSDSGLSALADQPRLELILVGRTRVTEQGVADFWRSKGDGSGRRD